MLLFQSNHPIIIQVLLHLTPTTFREKYERKLKLFERLDMLILDDFLLHTITDEREVKILFMILEKRCEALYSSD